MHSLVLRTLISEGSSLARLTVWIMGRFPYGWHPAISPDIIPLPPLSQDRFTTLLCSGSQRSCAYVDGPGSFTGYRPVAAANLARP